MLEDLGYLLHGGWGQVYGWYVFRRVSKILLGKIVCLSFKWLLVALSA